MKEKVGAQVKVNWIKGSTEPSGENPMELSAQLPMLQFAIDDMRLSIIER
jgi:hypothetical protein